MSDTAPDQLEPVVRWLSHRPSNIDEHRTWFVGDDRLAGKLVVELGEVE